MPPTFTGCVEDPRPPEAQAKDFLHEELTAAAPLQWAFKPQSQWRVVPVRNQDGSSTCVAQTCATVLLRENELEENVTVEFSARDCYQRRANPAAEGMYGPDALAIISKFGTTTEALLPSQNMSEAQITHPFVRTDEMVAAATKYRAGGYVKFETPYTIDAIAAVVATGKAVMVHFSFEYAEWTSEPWLKDGSKNNIRHSVTAVDYTLDRDGNKCLVIVDSWGPHFGERGYRLISEQFLNARCFFAGYVRDLSNVVSPAADKPRYHFVRPLSFGMRNDPDVKALQGILRYEGLFPSDVDLTGNYLQVTARSVLAWQLKHGVDDPAVLQSLGGNNVGPKTRAALNALYWG